MSKTQVTEDERIATWRAERARIAEADKAARIAQRKTQQAKAKAAADEDRKAAAVQFLRSVPSDNNGAQPPVSTPEIPPAVNVPPLAAAPRPASHNSKPRRTNRPALGFLAVVVAPMVLVAIYLFAVATPLYEAQSVIAITKSSDAANTPRSGLLGGLDQPANLQEVFRADTYIRSQALMGTLESELGLVSELSGPAVDPVRRLRTLPVLSLGKHAQFGRFVTSSVDVQSGQLTLYVRTPSDTQAVDVSKAVLRHAQEQVALLGQTLFEARQTYAGQIRAVAEAQLQEAQTALIALQVKYQEVDPRNRVENIYARIKEFEAESQRLRNEIQKAEIAGVGDSRQTEKTIALEAHIREQIAVERAQLVAPNAATGTPLNNLVMEYEMASLEVELAREAVQSAITAQTDAGREAALNRPLFQVIVPPSAAQIAAYPKIPSTLGLTFLLCLTAFALMRTLGRSRYE